MVKITVEILEVIKSSNYELVGMGNTVDIVEHRNDTQVRINMPRDTFNSMARELLRRSGMSVSGGDPSMRQVVVGRSVSGPKTERRPTRKWPTFETGAVACDRCGTTGGVGKPGAVKPTRYKTTKVDPPGTYCKNCYNYLYDNQIGRGNRLSPEDLELLRAHNQYSPGRPIADSLKIVDQLRAGAL